MERTFLASLVSNPLLLCEQTVKPLQEILLQTPSCKIAAMLYLMNLERLNSTALEEAMKRYLPLFRDKRALDDMLESSRQMFSVADGQSDRTMTLIDAFLGPDDEPESIMPVTAQPAYDISSLDDVQQEPSADSSDDLISRFLESDVKMELKLDNLSPDEAEDDESDSLGEGAQGEMFTETLAQILIRQRQYERALEIIRSLYLNFPNKSAYFADQIRYLEKLVKINKTK